MRCAHVTMNRDARPHYGGQPGGRFHRGKHKEDNTAMHVDHLMFAAGPAGLDEDAARLGEILGTSFINGGVHPSFGTRNRILPPVSYTHLTLPTIYSV